LDERQQVANGMAERRRIPIRPPLQERIAKVAPGPRLLVEELATGFDDLVELEPDEIPPERTSRREAPMLDDLEDRPQGQPIVGRQEVDGRPHHRDRANSSAICQQPGQFLSPETLEPRPECGVRIERLLGLERDQVLDPSLGRHDGPAKEELPLE
jgi:hypothetical protein